jgi:hypothetical protein
MQYASTTFLVNWMLTTLSVISDLCLMCSWYEDHAIQKVYLDIRQHKPSNVHPTGVFEKRTHRNGIQSEGRVGSRHTAYNNEKNNGHDKTEQDFIALWFIDRLECCVQTVFLQQKTREDIY